MHRKPRPTKWIHRWVTVYNDIINTMMSIQLNPSIQRESSGCDRGIAYRGTSTRGSWTYLRLWWEPRGTSASIADILGWNHRTSFTRPTRSSCRNADLTPVDNLLGRMVQFAQDFNKLCDSCFYTNHNESEYCTLVFGLVLVMCTISIILIIPNMISKLDYFVKNSPQLCPCNIFFRRQILVNIPMLQHYWCITLLYNIYITFN